MPIVNANDYQWIFSLNKQSDIRTALADGALKYCRSARNFAPITEVPQNIVDRNWYGKGHSFSTFVDRLTAMFTVPAQERSASNLETLFALAYCMGKVQTTGSSGASGYTHVINFNPTSTVKEVRYTTFVEIMGTEWKKKTVGAWINTVTLTGNRADHVVLSYEGGARNMETTTLAAPSISTCSFFKTLYGTVSFGASGALADISAEVLQWNISITQNAQPLFLMGNSHGEEMYLSKVLIGKQTVTGSFVIMVNSTHRDKFLQDVKCGLTINCVSPDHIGGGSTPHSLAITLPEVKIIGEAMGLEGDSVSYTCNLGEDGILKTGVGEPITCTMVTDISDTELLVNG